MFRTQIRKKKCLKDSPTDRIPQKSTPKTRLHPSTSIPVPVLSNTHLYSAVGGPRNRRKSEPEKEEGHGEIRGRTHCFSSFAAHSPVSICYVMPAFTEEAKKDSRKSGSEKEGNHCKVIIKFQKEGDHRWRRSHKEVLNRSVVLYLSSHQRTY